PAVVEIPSRHGQGRMASARLPPLLLHVLEPFPRALREQRPNPTRDVEHLARSRPSPSNQNLGALPGLFVYPNGPIPSFLGPTFDLDRDAYPVTKRVHVDLCQGLPAQLLPQTQPELVPGTLQAPSNHQRVLHGDPERPTL